MFAKAYMGRKRIFQMLLVQVVATLAVGRIPLPAKQEPWKGAAPHLFRPMYAEANMGHPSSEGD